MNDKGNPRANKPKQNARSKRPQVKDASWGLADEQLDDALRQTFPASDAISIIQNACGDLQGPTWEGFLGAKRRCPFDTRQSDITATLAVLSLAGKDGIRVQPSCKLGDSPISINSH